MTKDTVYPVSQFIDLKHLFSLRFKNYQPEDIKKLRESLDMARGDFGKLFFSTPGTVKKWETGKRAPSSSAMRILGIIEHLSEDHNGNVNNRIRRALR